MKRYRVALSYTEVGIVVIAAKSEDQAKDLAEAALDEDGTAKLDGFECNHREWYNRDFDRLD